MKKINCFIFLLSCLLLSFCVFGCRNQFVGSSVNGQTSTEERSYLRISTDESSSRTILPELSLDELDNIELKGCKEGSNVIEVLGVWNSFESLKDASVPVSTGNWLLMLTATEKNTVLYGETCIEVKNGANPVSFELSVKSYSKQGNGNLYLRLSFPLTENVSVYGSMIDPYTFEPFADYEEEKLEITTAGDVSTVIYEKEGVQSGIYLVRIDFFDSTKVIPLNTYFEVANISEDMDSKAVRSLAKLNTIYSITYHLNGGSFVEGSLIQSSFSRKSGFSLPDSEQLSKEDYEFKGWYADFDCIGDVISYIPVGTVGNLNLYAKWLLQGQEDDDPSGNGTNGIPNSSRPYISATNTLAIVTGNTKILTAVLSNSSGSDTDGFSFTVRNLSDSEDDVVELSGWSSNGTAYVKGLSEGFAEITVKHKSTSVTRKVLVFVADSEDKLLETMSGRKYLITANNVLQFSSLNASKTVSLVAKNLSEYEATEIEWESDNSEIATVVGNGKSAAVVSCNYGNTIIRASHPDCNSVEFHIFVSQNGFEISQIQGNGNGTDGINGADGADGVNGIDASIKSSIAYYLISSSNYGIKASQDGWSTTYIQPTESKKYLWYYSKIIYTNGTYTETVPCIIATYGKTITSTDTDVTIVSMTPYYLISASSSMITVSSPGWSTTYKEPTEAKKYLWCYREIVYSNNNKTITDPEIIGVYGSSGTEGFSGYTDGNGTSVDTAKYLTTSQNVISVFAGTITTVNISTVGIPAYLYGNITWVYSDNDKDNDFAQIVSVNGTSASIRALSAGSCTLTVDHPLNDGLPLTIHIEVYTRPVAYISANTDVIMMTKDSSLFTLIATLANAGSVESSQLNGFSFTVENESIATISTQYLTGQAYIKPVSVGETEITITHPSTTIAKKVLVVVANSEEDLAAFTYLTTSQNVVTLVEGSSRSVSVTMNNAQKDEYLYSGYLWESSNPSIASILGKNDPESESESNTVVIQGLKPGTVEVTVTNETACKYPLKIIVQVISASAASAFPYIQVSSPVINLPISDSWTTLTAELSGGKDSDASDFRWTAVDPTMLDVYGQNGVGKVRAKRAGIGYITVSHDKAIYSQQILCICDDTKVKDCSISVSCPDVLTLKPKGGDYTLTASLIGGSSSDRFNFSMFLDRYDYIDLVSSGNTAVITPKREGVTTLTIHHDRCAYDMYVKIKVQEYNDFSFGINSKQIVQGSTTFINMQIPASNVDTSVIYTSNKPEIVHAEGTKAVCQLTGVASGTATVTAKLVNAKNEDDILATAEILIYVKPDSSVMNYISSSSTVYQMTKGSGKIFSAGVYGSGTDVTSNNSLVWKSSDDTILKLANADASGNVSGANVYAEAVGTGECTLTVSHPLCGDNTLVMHIIIPEIEGNTIKLSSTYMSMKVGDASTLKATLTGTVNDSSYNAIIWSAEQVEDEDIVRIMGSGQTVGIYALKPGETTVTATLADGIYATCDIYIDAAKTLTLKQSVPRLSPNDEPFRLDYTYSPKASTNITWNVTNVTTASSTNEEYIAFVDHNHNTGGDGDGDIPEGTGYLMIECIGAPDSGNGTVTLTGVTNHGNKAAIQIITSWNYSFSTWNEGYSMQKSVKSVLDNLLPGTDTSIGFVVTPKDAEIIVNDSENILDKRVEYEYEKDKNGNPIKDDAHRTGRGSVHFKPTKEGRTDVELSARNKKNGKVFSTSVTTCTFSFSELKFNAELVSRKATAYLTDISKSGRFSEVDNGFIKIADGETIEIDIKPSGPSADSFTEYALVEYTIDNSSKVALNNAIPNLDVSIDKNTGKLTLKHSYDRTANQYHITTGYSPTYKGSRYYSDGTLIKPEDFKFSSEYEGKYALAFRIQECKWYVRIINNTNNAYMFEFSNSADECALKNDETYTMRFNFLTGIIVNTSGSLNGDFYANSDWDRIRDKSLDDTFYDIETFRKKLWWYIPEKCIYSNDKVYASATTAYVSSYQNTGGVDSRHISATLESPTTNTSEELGKQAVLTVLVSRTAANMQVSPVRVDLPVTETLHDCVAYQWADGYGPVDDDAK